MRKFFGVLGVTGLVAYAIFAYFLPNSAGYWVKNIYYWLTLLLTCIFIITAFITSLNMITDEESNIAILPPIGVIVALVVAMQVSNLSTYIGETRPTTIATIFFIGGCLIVLQPLIAAIDILIISYRKYSKRHRQLPE